MILRRDRVAMPDGSTGVVEEVRDGVVFVFLDGVREIAKADDADVVVLCGLTPIREVHASTTNINAHYETRQCERIASLFDARTERAICEWCARDFYSRGEAKEEREGRVVHCPCVCGKDLSKARADGVWTLGGEAVEMRTCLSCRSTRAWMPRNRDPEHLVVLHPSLSSTEIEGEWCSLLDALEACIDATTLRPLWSDGVLYRAGRELARVVRPDPAKGESASNPAIWRVAPA